MRFNIQGRMRNMRLPDGRTALLYSIFEAVMNSIQAIEERFPHTSYIEKLQSKTVRDAEGEVVSEITTTTPFECIVVCDLTEGAKAKLRRGVAQNPTPDGLGFYGFSPAHNASIRVISYRKLFRDGRAREPSCCLRPAAIRRKLIVHAGKRCDIAVVG